MKRYHSLAKSFVAFFIVSIILSASSLSQSWNIHVSAQNPKENNLQSSSLNQSEINDLSKAILDKYKPRVLEHLFGNKTIASNISSNSSIPAAIVVGVITPNGTQVSAYGNISKSNPTPVDGNTIFDVGSVTKTFVATVLADLVNQGVVKLSDPLEMYLPSNVTVPSYNGSKITLGDLATHTSGLPYWPSGWIWNKYYTTQQVYEFLSNSTFEDEPGTVAKYSNIGMGMVGQAISLKMGVPLIQLIEDRILNVLGMNSTSIALSDEQKSRLAIGHLNSQELPFWNTSRPIAPAGGLHSSVADMLKFASANLGLIDTKINNAMKESHIIVHDSRLGKAFSNNYTAYVSLGWIIATDLGTQILEHNGETADGYNSFIALNTSKEKGIVIIASASSIDIDIANIVFGPRDDDFSRLVWNLLSN